MSRSLNKREQKYSAVEKEASAVIEATRKWFQFLKGRHFTLVTDQRSVAFMFDQKNHGKIKNTKIMVWRLELGQLNYSIRHRPGKDNVAPDAMSRICSSMSSVFQLRLLHDQLGHPGFARMYHFIRSHNLPYTSEDTNDIIDKCETCFRLKPRFFHPAPQSLVKATRPWERLSLDFKGPVRGSKPYLLITALPPMRLLMNECFDFSEK